MAYPTDQDSFTSPAGTSLLTSPDHADLHARGGTAIVELEKKVGLSAGTPTLNKLLVGSGNGSSTWTSTWNNGVIGTPAVTGGTLNNTVLGTITQGSDATGDTYYRNSSGLFTRLGIGAAGRFLTTDGTTPSWGTVTASGGDGWTSDSNTWTYSGVDGATGTVLVNADVTANIQIGDRIGITQTTAKYFLVSKAPTVASGTTTIIMWGGTDFTLANAAITSPKYSHAKSPYGFDASPAKWGTVVTDTSQRDVTSPTAGTWYNPGTVKIDVPIGVWNIGWEGQPHVDGASVTQVGVYSTLSTGTASESDAGFSTIVQITGASANMNIYINMAKGKQLTVTSKTTYFLNVKTGSTGIGTVGYRGDLSTTRIQAIFAYL